MPKRKKDTPVRHTYRNPDNKELCVTDGPAEGYDDWDIVGQESGALVDDLTTHHIFDEDAGKWVNDASIEVDQEAGLAHIQAAHAQKALEACMILSGVELKHGLLVEEAQLTGEDLTELAQTVHDKAEARRKVECKRMKIKRVQTK